MNPARCNSGRRRLLGFAAALSASTLAAGQPDGAPATALPPVLRLGLVPYLSTRSMVAVFEPLQQHLERQLQRTVVLYTAADLRAFGERLRDGAYDIAFAPVHFMRLAEQDWGLHIVAQVGTEAKVVIVTRSDSALRTIADLAGRRLVSLDRLAITSMLLLDWLASRGLRPGRDLKVDYLVTASSTLRALQDDEVTALVLIESMLSDFPPAVAGGLRVMLEVARFPPPGYVVARRLGEAAVAQVQAALISFGDPAKDAPSLSRSSIRPSSLAASQGMERYARQLREMLR